MTIERERNIDSTTNVNEESVGVYCCKWANMGLDIDLVYAEDSMVQNTTS
jgi:hypothetical protein